MAPISPENASPVKSAPACDRKAVWGWAILLYVTGIVGFSGSIVSYDALLPAVASETRIDSVSSLGYAMGYLGGGLLFLVNVLMTLMPERFGLPDAVTAVRYAFLTVALWWSGFTLFTVYWVPEVADRPSANRARTAIFGGIQQIGKTRRDASFIECHRIYE